MKHTIIVLLAHAFLLVSLNAAEKPNILFILSDDQAYETVGAYGLTDIDTPNLDRLANRGTSFTKAYNMGAWNGAVCMASRACLITGAFLWRAQDAVADIDKGTRKSWSKLLSDQGYETYMTGKWHINELAVTDLFDHVGTMRKGMPRSRKAPRGRPIDEKDYEKGWKPWDKKESGFWAGGKHWSEVTADESLDFIKLSKKSEKPFFMYIAFNAPHDPRQAPKEYVDRYPLDRIKLPESFIPTYPEQNAQGVPKIRDEDLMPYPRTEYAVKVHRQEYYAIISHMDTQIGRILDELEASGKADNTWIIFTSDHGLAVGHHGLAGKQNMYEHSLCAPFIISGPGVKAGVKLEMPIYLQDAMTTTLEISGAEIPKNVDYKSVLPLLNGEVKKSYDHIYGAYIATQRMVKKDGWKLISYPHLKKVKLFHVAEDSLELKDLSKNPEHAERLQQLSELLEETMDEMDDPMTSIENADYNQNIKKGKGK